MDKKTLKIQPYNDIWLDCINNNLVAMLIAEEESFKRITLYLQVKYIKMVFDQYYNSAEAKEKMITEGFMTPGTDYSFDIMNELIEMEKRHFKLIRFQEFMQFIKNALREDFYIFLQIDRYFYPSGRESGVTHMVHPVFIHGYNDEEDYFYAIEDCVNPGINEYYALPYSAVKRSFEHFVRNDEEIAVTLCKTRNRDVLVNFFENKTIPLTEAKQMATSLLEDRTIYKEEHDLYYHSGLSSFDHFGSELDEIYNRIQDKSIFGIQLLSLQQVHKRNQELIRFLQENHLVETGDSDKLISLYTQIQKEWGIFKGKSYYMLEMRDASGQSIHPDNLNALKDRLKAIRSLEETAAHNLLTLCQ
ncbi:hypothetical protein [Cohnella mopanensis]|uniref:hypothetical protein n=1 Tax=Cohnella mopanensis TaxID=2911966 RepID=UPI001EF7F3A0|nr:hypothetical protein [Cohnella mopanensis]